MPSIVFKDVGYSYVNNGESYQALEGINLEIRDGEFLCLVGHSGCGKSTMLSLIAGLASPTRGEILVDGAPVSGPGPQCSIVFQSYSLFPWQTALRNVTFAIRKTNRSMSKEAARARALELLEQVGVGQAAARYPFQLSGGMRQRVAIARALAVDAPTMLLDEPFGALDPMIRRKLQTLLLDLWEGSCCKTAVFVTHDIEEALLLADRVVFMSGGRFRDEFAVSAPRPRDTEAYLKTPEYELLRRRLMDLFYQAEETSMDQADRERVYDGGEAL